MMSSATASADSCAVKLGRAAELFEDHQRSIFKRTDRMFAGLLAFQWLAGVIAAAWISPLTWEGASSSTHIHVLAALYLGGAITALPVALALLRPGRTSTRHIVGISQMLMGALLIHLTGGRIETHFHVFGSLAFLAFYRDWRVLLSASAVVAGDHLIRGYFWPQSVYGVLLAGDWRWLEHAGWVVFEDFFLIQSCRQSVREMRQIAERQAQLEGTREQIEEKVQERTVELFRALEEVDAQKSELQSVYEENKRVLTSIPSILIGVDAAGLVTKWNRSAEDLLGIAAPLAIGRPLLKLSLLQDDERLATSVRRCLETGEPARIDDFPYKGRDGAKSFLGVSLTPITEPSGAFLGLLLLAADITERRNLEMQLAHAQKMESIGQLAAGIAHEINTPIQFVGDNMSFLREAFDDLHRVQTKQSQLLAQLKGGGDDNVAGVKVADDNFADDGVVQRLVEEVEQAAAAADLDYLNEEVPRAIEQTMEGVVRVARIVRAMKEFSHPGSEDKILSDLNKLIENTIVVAHNEWKYVADLVTDFDFALPPVPCLAGEFNQVILNLIVNAAHAIEDRLEAERLGGGRLQFEAARKGEIAISTRNHGDRVEIRVRDSGTGIPDDVRSKVFDPFFTTKPIGKGSGQGLAIAHAAIVKKHGGLLSFETEVGKGTTFIIQLPRAERGRLSSHGLSSHGLSSHGLSKQGLSKHGLSKHGLDGNGRDGNDRDGNDRDGNGAVRRSAPSSHEGNVHDSEHSVRR
ncbi:MAG: PAS domain-containing protein [Planctomycetes bacterium]|nr:PAS domain-containing protein [Planctomycetota bacterium]